MTNFDKKRKRIWEQQTTRKSWEDYAKQHPEELVGGRSSTKSLYLTPPKPRDESKNKKLSKECKWIWLEELSEFDLKNNHLKDSNFKKQKKGLVKE